MTGVQPRPNLAKIPLYRAGKPTERDEFKLSSNENPFNPLPGVIEAATRELDRINRYPDAGLTRLYSALSAELELPAEQLVAGTGSASVLYTLLASFAGPGDEVIFAWRSFEAYPIAVDVSAATAVPVPLRADGSHDLVAMADALTERTKVVLVCTPNNPTGPVVRQAEWDDFIVKIPADVLVVIDEAYVEFIRDDQAISGLTELERHANVVVLRTFSKAYGLAGLRVGYAVGLAELIGAVRGAVPPFSVTDVAQAAAVASLQRKNELAERVDFVVSERERVTAGLAELGWQIPASQSNFVWLPTGADSLALAASQAPLSVRPFDGDGVRVTIGTAAANQQFLERIATWEPPVPS